MTWKSWLFKEYPKRSICLIFFLILLWIGIFFSFGQLGFIISIILLGGGVFPYFIPTYYSLDDKGVTIKGLILEKKKLWNDFQSYYKDKNGVLLSPFPNPTRLENYRGTYLRFSKNAQEVLDFISARIIKGV